MPGAMPTSSWACPQALAPGHAHEDVGMAPRTWPALPGYPKNCPHVLAVYQVIVF